MTPRLRCLQLVFASCALAGLACGPGPPERIDTGGRLGAILLFQSRGEPAPLVFLFSDTAGFDASFVGAAQRLRADGVSVVGVDLAAYQRALRASDDGCHYVVGEIESFSQRIQHDLAVASYASPILAGVGQGATLAYAAIAQAPAATIAGALGVDPAPALDTRVPLCAGAPATALAGGFAYGPAPQLHGFWMVSSAHPLDAPLASLARAPDPPIDPVAPPLDRLVTLVAAARARTSSPVASLPLTILEAKHPGPLMAVIYSGDGGWRDLDKTIGEQLADRGVPVVGVDSLRYFWRAKTQEQVARDLAQILETWTVRFDARGVVLIGYSFGAGILPFAVDGLPAQLRARVVQLSLLGVGSHADFQFRMQAWLGAEPGPAALPVMPALLRIDPSIVQCFYGEAEEDTLCRDPRLSGVEIFSTPGGHHFDGNYAALAEKIFAGAERRLSARSSP
jgi:type IV secretory pathway VirJ component